MYECGNVCIFIQEVIRSTLHIPFYIMSKTNLVEKNRTNGIGRHQTWWTDCCNSYAMVTTGHLLYWTLVTDGLHWSYSWTLVYLVIYH